MTIGFVKGLRGKFLALKTVCYSSVCFFPPDLMINMIACQFGGSLQFAVTKSKLSTLFWRGEVYKKADFLRLVGEKKTEVFIQSLFFFFF